MPIPCRSMREAPILTAQPDADAQARAPHLLYGHVSGARALFRGPLRATMRAGALDEARAMQRMPIFAGGTGLYFTALTDGLADIPPVPAGDPRRSARAAGRRSAWKPCTPAWRTRDPQTAAQLARPPIRSASLRAYEVFEATGRPLAAMAARASAQPVLKDFEAGALRARSAARRICAPASPTASRPCSSSGGLEEAAGPGRSRPGPAGRQAAGPAPASGPARRRTWTRDAAMVAGGHRRRGNLPSAR